MVKMRVFIVATVELVEIPASVEYVASYQKAIKDGKLEDAKQFAKLALDADPTCFVK
jgi:hypothetical protein